MEPDKCAGWEWYKVSDLPENILEGHRSAIDLLEKFYLGEKDILVDRFEAKK